MADGQAENLLVDREKQALRVLDRLDKRRSDGKFDFTIIVGKKQIHAEQNVLASGSDYFDAMFSHDTKERQSGQVEMVGVDHKSVKACVDYIYGKSVSVSTENLETLMFLSHMMQLEGLSDALGKHMQSRLDINSVFHIRNIATTFGHKKLYRECKVFAEDNLAIVAKETEFQTVDKAFVKELIVSPSVQIGEEKKLEILLDWVKFDDDRTKDLLELLKCIDFSHIPSNIGQMYIENETLIKMDSKILAFFSNALKQMTKPVATNSYGAKNIALVDRKLQWLHLFETRTNAVKKLHIPKPDIVFFSLQTLDGYIYALSEKKSVHRFNISDGDYWQRMADMLEEHGMRPPATISSGCIYVIGSQSNVSTRAVERYDPSRNVWCKLSNTPHRTSGAEVLASGRFIYCFGGMVSGDFVDDVRKFDTVTQEWASVSPMSERKGLVSATEWGNVIYVAGGYNGRKRLTTLERYNALTGQWTTLTQMRIGLACCRIFAVEGCLYAVGGSSRSGSAIEKYDIRRDTWMSPVHSLDMDTFESVTVLMPHI